MSQITFNTRDDEGRKAFVQTGWDRMNQGWHLTAWWAQDEDEDRPFLEKDPPFDRLTPPLVFELLRQHGILIDHRQQQRIELMLYNHRALDLGQHIENIEEEL